MHDFFDFYVDRGCFWSFISIGLLIYAIVCLAAGVHIRSAWLILIGEALNIVLHIIYRRVIRKKYNRKDSFWLREDDKNDPPKEEQ